jgi:hypothetical protein
MASTSPAASEQIEQTTAGIGGVVCPRVSARGMWGWETAALRPQPDRVGAALMRDWLQISELAYATTSATFTNPSTSAAGDVTLAGLQETMRELDDRVGVTADVLVVHYSMRSTIEELKQRQPLGFMPFGVPVRWWVDGELRDVLADARRCGFKRPMVFDAKWRRRWPDEWSYRCERDE